MKRVLRCIALLLAFLLFALCLGESVLDLMIAHSMRTRGNFHGIVFPAGQMLYSGAFYLVLAIAFLSGVIAVVRKWFKAKPPQWDLPH